MQHREKRALQTPGGGVRKTVYQTSAVPAAAGTSAHTMTVMPDGTQLAVDDRGAGPAILLVHGWAVHGGFFAPLQAALQTEFRVITPDLRGHGLSAGQPGPATMDALADDLAALMEAMDLTNTVALGWSMGAMALWRMIERHGASRLAGLVIEDMSPRILNAPGWSLGMTNGLDAPSSARAVSAMRQDWPGHAAAFAPHMFAHGSAAQHGDLIAWSVAEIAAHDPEIMASFWASMARQDFRTLLPSIRIPTLVLYGERSHAYSPETSRFLVETMPEAGRLGFARSGHAPHLEEPERFSQAVADFARRVQAGAANNQT